MFAQTPRPRPTESASMISLNREGFGGFDGSRPAPRRPTGAMHAFTRGLFATAAALTLAAPAASAAAPELLTEENVIAGTMNIDFATRSTPDTSGKLREGSPAAGAKDKYTFSLNVVKTTEFAGEITRQPNLYSRTLQRKQQDAQMWYKVDLAVLNPKDLKQKRTVGRWVGTVPVDQSTGAFNLSGGRALDSALRINVDAVGKAPAFIDAFDGRLVGKAEKKTDLASYTYKRLVGGKTVEVKVAKVDPMRFDSIVLAKGPAEIYPRTTVNGRLDYDYETGNYFADGIRMTYTLDGQEYEDIISGTIKWVEDPDRKGNGKGQYEFNLRFNEAKNAPASGEGDAFENMAAEDAFFAVDNSVPCLTGRIAYVDTFGAGADAAPTASKVTYSLHANKLSRQQVMNFFKLWLIAVGPTNDE